MKETKGPFERYNPVAVVLHWLSAVVVMGLFGLGLYMVELGYYHEWYRTAPHIHKSVGFLLLVLTLLRLVWRFISNPPSPLAEHSRPIQLASQLGHWVLYMALIILMVSGYLISTADGRAIAVFSWFEVPALVTGIDRQAELAGQIHFYLAWGLMGLAGVHALAALKHHWWDKDVTLKRMWFG